MNYKSKSGITSSLYIFNSMSQPKVRTCFDLANILLDKHHQISACEQHIQISVISLQNWYRTEVWHNFNLRIFLIKNVVQNSNILAKLPFTKVDLFIKQTFFWKKNELQNFKYFGQI